MTQQLPAPVDVTPRPLALMARFDIRLQDHERRLAALEAAMQHEQLTEQLTGPILGAAAARYGISVEVLVQGGRDQRVVRSRWVAAYVIRYDLGMSIRQVAMAIGASAPSTIIHALDQVDAMLPADAELRQDIEMVRKAIGRLDPDAGIGARTHAQVVDGAVGPAEAAALERMGEGH